MRKGGNYRFLISVQGKFAAAEGLPVKTELSGQFQGTFKAVFLLEIVRFEMIPAGTDPEDHGGIFVWTDREGSTEIHSAAFCFCSGTSQRPFETKGTAGAAFGAGGVAVQFGYMIQPGGMIVWVDNKFQIVMLRKEFYAFQSFIEFLGGNDIGIGKIKDNPASFGKQTFHTGGSAGTAADMQEQGRGVHDFTCRQESSP